MDLAEIRARVNEMLLEKHAVFNAKSQQRNKRRLIKKSSNKDPRNESLRRNDHKREAHEASTTQFGRELAKQSHTEGAADRRSQTCYRVRKSTLTGAKLAHILGYARTHCSGSLLKELERMRSARRARRRAKNDSPPGKEARRLQKSADARQESCLEAHRSSEGSKLATSLSSCKPANSVHRFVRNSNNRFYVLTLIK